MTLQRVQVNPHSDAAPGAAGPPVVPAAPEYTQDAPAPPVRRAHVHTKPASKVSHTTQPAQPRQSSGDDMVGWISLSLLMLFMFIMFIAVCTIILRAAFGKRKEHVYYGYPIAPPPPPQGPTR